MKPPIILSLLTASLLLFFGASCMLDQPVSASGCSSDADCPDKYACAQTGGTSPGDPLMNVCKPLPNPCDSVTCPGHFACKPNYNNGTYFCPTSCFSDSACEEPYVCDSPQGRFPGECVEDTPYPVDMGYRRLRPPQRGG